jgi:hypothetical protein
VRANSTTIVAVLALAGLTAGCGDLARLGRSPVQVVINSLEASGGGEDDFGGFLQSDVITRVKEDDPASCTIINDVGQVTMSLVLKDPGQAGNPAAPSSVNQVTFTSYRVRYRRTDGRNTEGVDVPYGFSSAATFTVPESGQVTAGFNLVRQTAKLEAPLLGLRRSSVLITLIADIEFYGRDQAGNDITAAGSIGVTFGDFGPSC